MTGTILLTGANGSLALAAVRYSLTYHPDYTLLLTVRNTSEKDENTDTLRELLAEHPENRGIIRQLDLGQLNSVADFARNVAAEVSTRQLPPLTSIICNAFFWNLNKPMDFTGDGFEKTIQIIHLAHASLVLHLLNSFHPQKGRIVLLSTDGVFPGKNSLEKLPPGMPDDLDSLVHPRPDESNDHLGHGFRRYANAKLAVVIWAEELNRRLERSSKLRHITAVTVNPGNLSDSRALQTNTPAVLQYMSKLIIQPMRPLLRILMDSTMRTSADAAKDVVRLATEDACPGERGYFILLERSQPPPGSMDPSKAEELWKSTAKWAGVSTQETYITLSNNL